MFLLVVIKLEDVELVLLHLLADTLFDIFVFVGDGLLLGILLKPSGEGGEIPPWPDMVVDKLIASFICMMHQGGT